MAITACPSTKQAAERLAEIDCHCNKPAWSAEMFRSEFSQPHSWIRIVTDQVAGIVGFVVCHVVVDEAHIQTLGVDPAFRRRGLARSLMSGLIAELNSVGVTWLSLEVRVSNRAALKLYQEQLGFFESGRRLGYYDDGHEDALVLRLSILDAVTRLKM